MERWLKIVMLVLLAGLAARAQSWQAQESHSSANLRGISAVNNKVAWASGTGGTYLRTTDGGEHWTEGHVPEAEQLDFRDVQAFDENRALLLGIGPGEKSRLYQTKDAGRHWTVLAQNTDPKAFWDCMAWWDSNHGVLVGDPVNGNFEVLVTIDGGNKWVSGGAPAMPQEGAFAASGSCVAVEGSYRELRRSLEWNVEGHVWLATGGGAARVLRSSDAGATWDAAQTPLMSGPASAGVFSVVFWNSKDGIAVGGDYQQPNATYRNVALTRDGGKTWEVPTGAKPHGYRSSVAYDRDGKLLVAVGTSGSDYSSDGGDTWKPIDNASYNAVDFAPDGTGWAVGAKGAIARWVSARPRSHLLPRIP